MIFLTESGSTYEVNTTDQKIRRLNGKKDPTPRMGKQGEWRPYQELFLQVGEPATIIYGNDVDLLPETDAMISKGGMMVVAKTTQTSPVKEIIEDKVWS
jgi:hypothetical protein